MDDGLFVDRGSDWDAIRSGSGVRRYIRMSNAVLGSFVSVEVKGNIERVRVRLGVEGLEMDEFIAFARHCELEG